MTLAVSIRVIDGIVLAADSASTVSQFNGTGNQITNVYENANKILHLHKDFPVGIITWGNGSVGTSSISTLIKDFRHNISTGADNINNENFTVKYIAEKFFDFITKIYNQNYQNQKPMTGFSITGYNIDGSGAEEWEIILDENGEKIHKVGGFDSSGIAWRGQPEALTRLIKGYSPSLYSVMARVGIESEKINQTFALASESIEAPLSSPAMPIQDAIELAEFLIDTTTKFIRFSPTPYKTVGGPIEIATITKHEGFKWIQRKLYFNSKYNPK